MGGRLGTHDWLRVLAAWEHAEGRPERTTRFLAAAAALRERHGIHLPPCDGEAHEALLSALRQALGPAAFTAAWSAGLALDWEEATAEALATLEPSAADARDPHDLTDEEWERVRGVIQADPRTGRPRADDRRVLDGIRYQLRTGCSRRDLPRRYGSASTCARRLKEWRQNGTWSRIQQVLGDPPTG